MSSDKWTDDIALYQSIGLELADQYGDDEVGFNRARLNEFASRIRASVPTEERTPHGQLVTDILLFLSQSAPHHRDRQWYKLLDSAQHALSGAGGPKARRG